MTEAPFLHATRESYDALSVDHLHIVATELPRMPVDRALLALFAEWVTATGNTTVADVGCGPGRLTKALHELGLEASGVDLSPKMIALARRAYPELRFEVGSMLALEIPDASLGGLLANYSIIHVPWERRPEVFAEFRRVLAPGGQLMLSFQVGDDRKRYDRVDDLTISLDFYRQQPEEVAGLLAEAGFEVRLKAVRAPDSERELTHQGYLLARRPVAAG
ncbi:MULTISPECIES: class I SAM-dependent methyltransferase [unclassified Plantactinospora]|uniref:class I SAM-dependent methyltransferase n=1 Tax=unclassified Plantactinospora TaxID=2631981 RepID=UPI000D169688|nr:MULTISPECIES: class I SAM-dependent methyltransferase [unclassified Plantactinospora]AVT34903.1 SAM-dependent methyltransferase [Plantactinospora sp. BC1]AVT36117.1 SAM-dependent methyltransferase [Plantactinospora sp. BB1]